MSDEGFVPRETVLAVLKSSGVSVEEGISDDDPPRHVVTISKGSVAEVHFLPDMVPRRMVIRFAHKLGVSAHYFWNPEKIPEGQRVPGLLSN